MHYLLLYIITLILYDILVLVIGVPYAVIKFAIRAIKRKSFSLFNRLCRMYFWQSSYELDVAAVAPLQYACNDFFIPPNGTRFGTKKKTLSHYFGVNKMNKTIYKAGIITANIIDFVFGLFGDKNHVEKAANR